MLGLPAASPNSTPEEVAAFGIRAERLKKEDYQNYLKEYKTQVEAERDAEDEAYKEDTTDYPEDDISDRADFVNREVKAQRISNPSAEI